MNVAHAKSGGCNRRSVTGDDFFARFPALHPFLLSELADAAAALERGAVHPSLYPILAVLSRLFESGDLRVNLDHVLPLSEAAEAHRLLEEGHTRGKIVLEVSPEK